MSLPIILIKIKVDQMLPFSYICSLLVSFLSHNVTSGRATLAFGFLVCSLENLFFQYNEIISTSSDLYIGHWYK